MKIISNLDLTTYNSYRVRAKCKRAFFPDSESDVVKIFSEYRDTKKIILGSGYNVIFSKEYYEEDFVIFSGNFQNVKFEGEEVEVEAGMDLYTLSNLALKQELSGLEIFYDIPSSLGGAIVMNAGASGEDIRGLLLESRYFDPTDGQVYTILKDDIGFEYRNSFFQKRPHLIVLSAKLLLKKGKYDDIYEKMELIKEQRWAKQPKEFPNAGSVFKRPKGYFVGAIMDELGLKGFGFGGAKVSEKHGGFIINYNNASGEDIINTIEGVQERVFQKYGFRLDVEQRII